MSSSSGPPPLPPEFFANSLREQQRLEATDEDGSALAAMVLGVCAEAISLRADVHVVRYPGRPYYGVLLAPGKHRTGRTYYGIHYHTGTEEQP